MTTKKLWYIVPQLFYLVLLLHAADLIHGVVGDDGVHVEMGREETVERLYAHKSVGHMLRRAFMTAVDGLAACAVSHRQPSTFL